MKWLSSLFPGLYLLLSVVIPSLCPWASMAIMMPQLLIVTLKLPAPLPHTLSAINSVSCPADVRFYFSLFSHKLFYTPYVYIGWHAKDHPWRWKQKQRRGGVDCRNKISKLKLDFFALSLCRLHTKKWEVISQLNQQHSRKYWGQFAPKKDQTSSYYY